MARISAKWWSESQSKLRYFMAHDIRVKWANSMGDCAQCPYLNHIEHLWRMIGRTLTGRTRPGPHSGIGKISGQHFKELCMPSCPNRSFPFIGPFPSSVPSRPHSGRYWGHIHADTTGTKAPSPRPSLRPLVCYYAPILRPWICCSV